MRIRLLACLLLAVSIARADEPLAGPATRIGAWGASEGPSWDPAGWLYWVSHERISRWDLHGAPQTVREGAGRPGSSLVDPQRRLLVCESGARRITRLERDGSVTVLADRFGGRRFNSPNDLALDPRGRVYFTDPRYGKKRDDMEMRDSAGRTVEGVYRIDAPGRVSRILTHEIEKPNGILVSPDGRFLYVADDDVETAGGTRKIWRFPLRPDGTLNLAGRRVLFDWGNGRGADGFKMDREGRFYVAAGQNRPEPPATTDEYKSGIYILSPEGRLLQFVAVGTTVQNCAFGGPDLRTLFVTAAGTLWSIPVRTPGVISAQPLSP